MVNSITHVAVAILRRADGLVLLAERPAGKPWAGWWEFPGGKIELNETPELALKREISEELGIEITQINPWIIRTFHYPEKTVKLHFFIVTAWIGEPQPCEGQTLSWQHPAHTTVSPMLPANLPILSALALPDVYAITNLAEMGEVLFFQQLSIALNNGLQMIQVREKHLSIEALKAFASQVIALSKPFNAKVLINGNLELAIELDASGVHLTSSQLMSLQVKPAGLMIAASCHNLQELQQAHELALDFVVLSPVQSTLSHLDVTPLGWTTFNELVAYYQCPVYALGGMTYKDKVTAWENGARGIALQRAAWVNLAP